MRGVGSWPLRSTAAAALAHLRGADPVEARSVLQTQQEMPEVTRTAEKALVPSALPA